VNYFLTKSRSQTFLLLLRFHKLRSDTRKCGEFPASNQIFAVKAQGEVSSLLRPFFTAALASLCTVSHRYPLHSRPRGPSAGLGPWRRAPLVPAGNRMRTPRSATRNRASILAGPSQLARGSVVVNALCYKLEGRGFDIR
jgi:hypothetical protein